MLARWGLLVVSNLLLTSCPFVEYFGGTLEGIYAPMLTGIILVYFVQFWGLSEGKVRLFRSEKVGKGVVKNLDGGFRHVCSSTRSPSPKIQCCCDTMNSPGASYKHLEACPFLMSTVVIVPEHSFCVRSGPFRNVHVYISKCKWPFRVLCL